MENKDELRKLVRILVFILAFVVSGVGGIGILIIGAGVAGVVANVGGSIIGAGLSIPAAASAVAIPKLFGMSAKAKASEIGPAAGTWIKLQQAYTMESDRVGDCSQISYTLPGGGETKNFTYKCGVNKDGIAFWVAENNEDLDECKAGNTWAVFMNKNYEIEVELPDGKSCQKLTPNFSKLGKQAAEEEARLAEEEAKRAAELEAIMEGLENIAEETEKKPSGNTFTDPRDGKTYRTVTIGKRTWMAENLNYETPMGSDCYNDNPQHCQKYGRLYSASAAKTACPTGWHLSSEDEWKAILGELIDPAAFTYSGASKLKSKSDCPKFDNQKKQALEMTVEMMASTLEGRRAEEIEKIKKGIAAMTNYKCTDDYGFSALPGGNVQEGRYLNIGEGGAFFGQADKSEHTLLISFGAYDMIPAVAVPSLQLTGSKGSIRCVKDS